VSDLRIARRVKPRDKGLRSRLSGSRALRIELDRLFREDPVTELSSEDPTEAVLQRVEVGRLLVLLTEGQRAIVVAHFYLGCRRRRSRKHWVSGAAR
jgi:hypothetical protein